MYGPKWPFLLMYESHDMRHGLFRGLTGCQRHTPGFGVSHQNKRFLFSKMYYRVSVNILDNPTR